MRDPERIDRIITNLRTFWKENPDWRLTQLVWNISKPGVSCPEFFYIEDDFFEKELQKEIK